MPSVHLRTAVGRAGRQPAPAPAPLSTSGRARCCSGSFCHLGRIFPLKQEHDCRGPVTCHTLGLAEGPVVVSEASRSPRRRQDSVWISAAAPAHLAEQTPVECLTGLVARSGLLPVLLLRSSTSAECTSVVSPGAQSQAGCAALLGRGRWGLALMPSLLSSRSASPAHLGREGSWLSGSSIGDSRPIL